MWIWGHSQELPDAGLALSQAGASTAKQVAGMIGPGILNQVVGQMQNNSVGIAQTEQVGNVKALAVGSVYTQRIGHQLKIDVGDEVIITVGPNQSAKSTLMRTPRHAIPMNIVR